VRKAIAWTLITFAEWIARDDVNRAVLLRAARLISQDDERYRWFLTGLEAALEGGGDD